MKRYKKMEKEKTPKKQKADFDIKNLSSYKSCSLDVKNLQKISEKVEQTGLVALVGLSKKIVSFYNEISENCEKNKLKTTDYFNLTSIRKYLYELVDYPQQKDADGKPIRNYVFENAVNMSDFISPANQFFDGGGYLPSFIINITSSANTCNSLSALTALTAVLTTDR